MTTTTLWQRVTRKHPCIICGKIDWCTFSDTGACCMRVESPRTMRNGGWFHKGGDASCRLTTTSPASKAAVTFDPKTAADMTKLLERWKSSTNGQISRLAYDLSVTELSLRELGTVYSHDHRAFAFPMSDGDGNITGIRLRSSEGRKWAVKGSKAGLFLPLPALSRLETNRIYVCEGPTDTAALLSIGLFAIGRPACLGCESLVADVIRGIAPHQVVIVTDNDVPGLRGAEKLASLLRCHSTLFTPPAKDARAFIAAGATPELFDAMVKNAVWNR